MINESLKDELLFYAPPGGSGLAAEWNDFTGQRQARYLEYCRKGHDMLAAGVMQDRQSGRLTSVKQLYRQAAHIRRAIAELSGHPHDNFHQYGQPVTAERGHLTDFLSPDHGSRYEIYIHTAKRRFKEFRALIAAGKTEEAFGDGYSARFQADATMEAIGIFHPDIAEHTASILHYPREGSLRFIHAHCRDRDTLFSLADSHVQNLSQGKPAPEYFWKEMGEISLHLYHSAPLKLGSQTATLMVLAGLTKAMGYEIVPRKHETDHFIEAELTPYRRYVQEYGQRFERPPQRHEPQAIQIDDAFMEEGMAKCRARYASLTTPREKLERYIATSLDIQGVSLEDLRIGNEGMRFRVFPEAYQDTIKSAFDFVGHDRLAQMLGLHEAKKMLATPRQPVTKESVRAAVPRGRGE